MPKIAYPLDGSTPFITGSGILDPDQLSFCTKYTCQLYEMHYIETRSRCVNMSFIINVLEIIFLVCTSLQMFLECFNFDKFVRQSILKQPSLIKFRFY